MRGGSSCTPTSTSTAGPGAGRRPASTASTEEGRTAARPGGARRAAHRARRAPPDAAPLRGPPPLGRPLGRGDRARARHRARNRQGAHPPRRAAPPRAARRGHPGEHEELTMPDLHDRIDGLFTDEPEHATGPAVHLRTGRRALRRRRITTGAARPRRWSPSSAPPPGWRPAADDSPRSDRVHRHPVRRARRTPRPHAAPQDRRRGVRRGVPLRARRRAVEGRASRR